MSKENDGRYPYTYACDYIRRLGECDSNGVRISRSEASQIREGIAKAIGMDDAELARKLADFSNENEVEISKRNMQKLMMALG